MANPKVYIDSCCIIDLARLEKGHELEGNRDEDIVNMKKLLQAGINNQVELCTSTFTIAECRHAKSELDSEIKGLFDSILQSGRVMSLVDPHPFIMTDARDLLWTHGIEGLSGADSVHLATAIYCGCKEFLTVDQRVLDKAQEFKKLGLNVIKPSETRFLPDKYAQENIEYED